MRQTRASCSAAHVRGGQPGRVEDGAQRRVDQVQGLVREMDAAGGRPVRQRRVNIGPRRPAAIADVLRYPPRQAIDAAEKLGGST